MNRRGKVYFKDIFAGIIYEDEDGYVFQYDESYLNSENPKAVSLTLPLMKNPYKEKVLFAFFDGIIPEGWLLEIAEENWKLNPRDRMGLLLSFCHDTIGAVSVVKGNEDD